MQAIDYNEQVLEPVVAPAFEGLIGYKGYSAKLEADEDWGLFVEDHAPTHMTKKLSVEVKRVLGIQLHYRLSTPLDLDPIENV
jgi:hypothetical protein